MDKLDIIEKMKSMVKICRGYLEFLNTTSGLNLAFLFDNIWKSIMLIVDEVLNSSEKTAEDRTNQAVKNLKVPPLSFLLFY